VEDFPSIVKNYLMGWALIDFVTSVPVTYLVLLIPGGVVTDGSLGFVRAPRILRMLKTLKVCPHAAPA
jgi:hypothetical protein